MKARIEKCKDKMTDGELRLFVFLISNVVILITVTLICMFFGVEPENRFGAAIMTSIIFSIIYTPVAEKENEE